MSLVDRAGRHRVLVVAARDLRTVARTWSVLVLGLVVFASVVGVVVAGSGAGGFVPLALDLLFTVEVLVPLFAFAAGYRAALDDRVSGELEAIRTYPLSRAEYVLGAYLGRALFVATVLFATLVVAGIVGATLAPGRTDVVAANDAADSLWLFVRFTLLTVGFGLTTLAIAVAVSAATRSVRGALAVVVALAVAFLVGVDAGVVGGLAGGLSPDVLPVVIALSPASAFRGLVLDLVVGAVSGRDAGSTLGGLVGLVGWFAGSLAVAVLTVWEA
ncbi:ABC transporter permease [Salinigranum salinum]|uniref:ABC transporter permease n=1 Tax=Salinigranum salinum TaxID=1364937 RepID=UPI0012605776|nr:ABC transporter permease subunit [Salinigranum salinum]